MTCRPHLERSNRGRHRWNFCILDKPVKCDEVLAGPSREGVEFVDLLRPRGPIGFCRQTEISCRMLLSSEVLALPGW